MFQVTPSIVTYQLYRPIICQWMLNLKVGPLWLKTLTNKLTKDENLVSNQYILFDSLRLKLDLCDKNNLQIN